MPCKKIKKKKKRRRGKRGGKLKKKSTIDLKRRHARSKNYKKFLNKIEFFKKKLSRDFKQKKKKKGLFFFFFLISPKKIM